MGFVYSDGGRSKYFKRVNVSDCVIRAICNATGKDYKEVYDQFTQLNNGKTCRNGTPDFIMNKYIKTKLGASYHKVNSRLGLWYHIEHNKLPKGNLLVHVKGHLTNVKDGIIYDTFDCSTDKRCTGVDGYWIIK